MEALRTVTTNNDNTGLIGGAFCHEGIDAGLLTGEGQRLSETEREFLWELFQAIGHAWDDVKYDNNLRSSWLEFIEAKTTVSPSYTAEYANAVSVIKELKLIHGEVNAYTLLFFRNGIPPGPPTTRLAHAKKYVVDEFIRVNIVASGFKAFGGKNYNGYIAGSRYNRFPKVRVLKEQTREPN